MNKDKILAVADAIEKGSKELGFNMNDYHCFSSSERIDHTGNNCGTVACIAGWTVFVEHGMDVLETERNIDDLATEILDLTLLEKVRLFEPFSPHDWPSIKPEHAIRVLRNFAETGIVDWEGQAHEE